MKKQIFIACIGLSALIFSAKVNAQHADTLTVQRLSVAENRLSKLPTVTGIVSTRYLYDEDRSSFDICAARVDMRGDIGKMFDYRLHVDFARSTRLLDARIRFKLKPYFNIQLGQYTTPFSLENQYSPIGLEAVDNALVISRLSGYSDVAGISGSSGRDIGIMFYGDFLRKKDFSMIEYSIGIFNGAGINTYDHNKSKDIIGSLCVYPVKPLTLSLSGYVGEVYLNDMPNATRNRYGAGVRYDDNKWLFRSEYIYGKTADMESSGTYAVFAYTFCRKLQPVFRVDYFQEDMESHATAEIDYMAGVNYWFVPQKVRLQFSFMRHTFQSDRAGTTDVCLIGSLAF
jgi:hypothetical protein